MASVFILIAIVTQALADGCMAARAHGAVPRLLELRYKMVLELEACYLLGQSRLQNSRPWPLPLEM